MALRKQLAVLTAGIMALTMLLPGCSKKGSPYPNTDLDLKPLGLTHINYETSNYTLEKTTDQILVTGKRSVAVGETFTATFKDMTALGTHIYYVVDWGDGTWSYRGPVNSGVALALRHAYKKAGTYHVKAMSVNVKDGMKSGWSNAFEYTAAGDDAPSNYIDTVEAISSDQVEAGHEADKIIDGESTYWQPVGDTNIQAEHYVGLRLDSHYRLDTVEIKIPKDCGMFPQNPAIEYTTDGGTTWYHLPRYYYVEDHSKEKFTPLMGFPNPAGATLVLDLDGIVANGIRISNKMYPIQNLSEPKYFQVEEMRVTGDKKPLYYSSYGDQFDADLNNMYTIYGSAKTEPSLAGLYWGNSMTPYEGGSIIMTVTEWYEWDEMQIIWTDYQEALDTFTARLFATRLGNDDLGNYGYVWQDPVDAKHMKHQAHYDLNSIFIIATRDYLLQRNDDRDIWSITNQDGRTMEQRIDDAMAYLLGPLDGESGLITIPDPANDGTFTGNASTYWDAFTCDGYQSSFVNIMFYAALNAMADIEVYRGNTDKAAYYTDLAAKTRDRINETFWDDTKGRYIMSIDINGDKHDYGTTYMNMSAVAYGVATKEQADKIYEWLDGDRIIEGDTSTGEDIYGKWVYAARANTVDVASIGPPYCWENWSNDSSNLVGALDPRPGGSAEYGASIQNGGNIFYTSYYDVMGRFKQLGADDAMERFRVILDEFHKDELRRRTIKTVAPADGITGEFPESGIVPLVFQDGVIGLQTTPTGISVTPNLPSDMTYAGIREYWFNGQVYSIKATESVKEPTIEPSGEGWYVQIPADGSTYEITLDNTVVKLSK